MRIAVALSALVVVAGAVLAPSLALADGVVVFQGRCASCHTVTGKSGPAGPSLKGVAGRKLAGANDYSYSAGLRAKGGVWSDAALDAFLSGPSRYAPGTKMFAAVSAPADRAAVIAYLNTLH